MAKENQTHPSRAAASIEATRLAEIHGSASFWWDKAECRYKADACRRYLTPQAPPQIEDSATAPRDGSQVGDKME